jgi:UDP-glucuronate 4-epimerase
MLNCIFDRSSDIGEGVVRIMGRLTQANSAWSGDAPDPSTSAAPYKVYNIGNNNPVELTKFIEVIEDVLGQKAKKELMDIQPGDVAATYADVDDLMEDVGFKPATPIEVGVAGFVERFQDFYEYR